jgi:hypothetical protein
MAFVKKHIGQLLAQCQPFGVMLKLPLDCPVCTDHHQLLELMPGPLILPLLALQPSCLPLYDNVIYQCRKWHHYNDRLLIGHGCYGKKQC